MRSFLHNQIAFNDFFDIAIFMIFFEAWHMFQDSRIENMKHYTYQILAIFIQQRKKHIRFDIRTFRYINHSLWFTRTSFLQIKLNEDNNQTKETFQSICIEVNNISRPHIWMTKESKNDWHFFGATDNFTHAECFLIAHNKCV